VFVDESKKQDYLLVAAVIIPGDLALARKTVRGLHKPGQRRLHMVKESPARQHTILSTLGTSTPRSRSIRLGRGTARTSSGAEHASSGELAQS